MKKSLLYSIFLMGAFLFSNIGNGFSQETTTHTWEKCKTGIWKGKKDNKIVSYKIDVECIVYSSVDEKKWEAVPKGMWTDFEGNVYRAANKMLFLSKDGGQTWDNAHGATWHGGDGLWYKFDDNWGVWISQQ